MTLLGLSFLLTTIIIGVLTWYYYRYFKLKTILNINGPFPLPLIGNALVFKNNEDILPSLTKNHQKYGKHVLLMVGTKPFIFTTDYEAIENLLSSMEILDKSFIYKMFKNLLNDGLLVSSGNKWKIRRRIITPSFHFQILEQFVPIFNKVTGILIEQLKLNKNMNAIDVFPYISLCTLDIICETSMGVSMNAQIYKNSLYVRSVKEFGKIMIDRAFSAIQLCDATYQFTDNCRREKECLRIIHGHTNEVINQRREELITKPTKYEVENDIGSKKKIALLDILLQAKDENGLPLSNGDIQEEVNTFMFAAHDTTTSAISFTLYEIAGNPDIQEKIIEEQNHILQGENRAFTLNDLSQLKYLEMVIKESLRMYPIVPFYGRQTTEEFQLTKNIKVPSDCTIGIAASVISEDPEVFPEPEKFDPERFNLENCICRKPFSFLPFSAGPRNCIGQKYAILQMKTIISKVVQKFELLPHPRHKLRVALDGALMSKTGIIVTLKERIN